MIFHKRQNFKKPLKALLSIAVTVAALFCVSTPVLTHAEVVDRIVAVVDDSIITLSELNVAAGMALNKVKDEKKGGKKDAKVVRTGALDKLINQKLIKHASDSAGIDVTEREVDNAIEDVKKQNNLTKKNLMLALAQNGLTMREYREQMKAQLREAKFVNMEFKSKISILPEEVEDYYRQNIEKFLQPPTFRARMIFLPSSDISVQQARLSVIKEGLKKNERFADLARQYSDGPSASNGGDLGWLSKGELDSVLEHEIEKLEKGEVSPVIKRPEGIYMLQLTQKREASPASLAEVTPSIQQTIFSRRLKNRLSSWLKEERKAAHVEIRL